MTEAGAGKTGIGRAIEDAIEERVLPELLRRHAPPALADDALRALTDIAQEQDDATLLGAVLAVADAVRERAAAGAPDGGGDGDGGGTTAFPPLARVCTEVLVPIARELGERWVRDEASFSEVTVGTGRLHAVLRTLSWEAGTSVPADAPRLLLLPTPGEDHRLGVSMAAALFRNAGWIVRCGEPVGDAELGMLLDRFPPDMVGFSASCDRHIPALADAVRAVRRLRPDLPVVGGGPLFVRRPGLVRRLRLDAAFTDAATAPLAAAHLLRERSFSGAPRVSGPSTKHGRIRDREGTLACAVIGSHAFGVGAGRAGSGSDPQDRAGDR